MTNPDLRTLIRVRHLAATGAARSIRLSAYLNPNDVAREVGVSVRCIQYWEAGKRVPNGVNAVRYAEVLDRIVAGA